MATSKTAQKPILSSDAPETAEESTKEILNTSQETFSKSRRRTSLNEFCIVNNIRPEIKAGFKVWLKGELFHFDDEWSKLFEDYTNREI